MTIAAQGLVLAAPAFAQGNSPWETQSLSCNRHLQPLPRPFPGSIVVSGLTFAFGEGGSKRVHGRRPLRGWHGHRRRQFPRMALSVRRVASKTL